MNFIIILNKHGQHIATEQISLYTHIIMICMTKSIHVYK